MNKSESIIKIAPALLKAQKEIGGATKGSSNPFFHSSYADLGAVMEACKDKLNENGISVLQPVGTDEGKVYVETILLHESGEYISDKMQLSAKEDNNPQAQGSAITYSRRYGLQSMLFIPAEDDDGEKAMSRQYDKKETKDPKWINEKLPNEKDYQDVEADKAYHEGLQSRPLICSQCLAKIDEAVSNYSIYKYDKVLCRDCQSLQG